MTDLPKGARTKTARRSRWVACALLVLPLALVLPIFWDEEGRWLRLVAVALWTTPALLYFRSWRIVKRFEAEQ